MDCGSGAAEEPAFVPRGEVDPADLGGKHRPRIDRRCLLPERGEQAVAREADQLFAVLPSVFPKVWAPALRPPGGLPGFACVDRLEHVVSPERIRLVFVEAGVVERGMAELPPAV